MAGVEKLNVHSIFESVSGEAGGILFPQGTWCSFIRLQGCNLRCEWCFGVIPGRRIPRIISSRGENIKLPEVKKGDLLMTFDPSGNIVETEVINTHQHQVDSWLRITIKGIQYFVTEEHPFFTTRGLIPANQLIIGDMILHSSGSQKISFQKKLMNPMKNPEVAAKSKEGTDYTKIGKAVSRAIQKKKEEGIYIPSYLSLSEEQKEEVKKKISIANSGANNGNWKGGIGLNYKNLKNAVRLGEIKHCQKCGQKSNENSISAGRNNGLDVHHRDNNPDNDEKNNLIVLCESCHYTEHQMGYNFWKKERGDGKKLKAMNGHEVEKIDYIERKNYPPSTRPAPLTVYNLTCAPYNSYLIDYMWVHNCDTTSSQDHKQVGKLMSPEEVVDACGNLKHILITGGEPMLQARELVPVIRLLLEKDCQIQIETNGSIALPSLEFLDLPSLCGTSWVIDYKCPSSGMTERMPDLETLADWLFLIKIGGGSARIKWVVKDNEDLDFALARIEELIYKHEGHTHTGMDTKHLISPLDGNGNRILEITEQIKRRNKDTLNHIIFSVQLHKIFGLA